MNDFNTGDWFVITEGQEPQRVEYTDGNRVVYVDERGMELSVAADILTKVPSPFPKLEKNAQAPSAFVAPPDVRAVLEEAEAVLHPVDRVAWDHELHHSMQEDLYSHVFQVMKDYPDYRGELLDKMLEIVALEIPRW